jgi:hypothetical protein
MDTCDGLELDAAFASTELLEIGARASLRVRVRNTGGDLDDAIGLRVSSNSGLVLVSTDVTAAGETSGRDLSFVIPGLLAGESREVEIDVYALCGGQSRVDVRLDCARLRRETFVTCLADGRAQFAPTANRLELDGSEAEAGSLATGRLVLTNTGRASAVITEIRLEGDLEDAWVERSAFELRAGERAILRVSARVPTGSVDGAALAVRAVAYAGTNVDDRIEARLGDTWIVARSRPRFEGTIEILRPPGERVEVGERIDWRIRVANVGGACAGSVSIGLHAAGSIYLPGSSRVEAIRICDRGGTSPLWSPQGLTLEGVAAGTELSIDVGTVADSGAGTATLWARIVCDGGETLLESMPLTVMQPDAAPPLGFVVCGALLGGAERVGKSEPDSPPVCRFTRSPRAALDAATIRYIQGQSGMMRHLWALGVLCADVSEDGRSCAQLATLRTALRSVFDRLAIKLRMPHYPVRPDDVLDPAASEALAALDGAPRAFHASSLGARLARAAMLVASEGPEEEIAAYREALAAKLRSFDEDSALIDALVVVQPVLDERLAAALDATVALSA